MYRLRRLLSNFRSISILNVGSMVRFDLAPPDRMVSRRTDHVSGDPLMRLWLRRHLHSPLPLPNTSVGTSFQCTEERKRLHLLSGVEMTGEQEGLWILMSS